MKKITCIQQYVIDRLIDDEKISIGNLIDAMSKVCSEEQFNNILSILIETPNRASINIDAVVEQWLLMKKS